MKLIETQIRTDFERFVAFPLSCINLLIILKLQAAELVSLRNLLYRHRVVKVMFKEQFRCVQFVSRLKLLFYLIMLVLIVKSARLERRMA